MEAVVKKEQMWTNGKTEEGKGPFVGDFDFDVEVLEGRSGGNFDKLGDLKVVEGVRRQDSAGLAQGRDCVAGRAWTSLQVPSLCI